MWLSLAFLSAALLGCYDAFKKEALSGNAVLPVLFLNTLFCSLVFLPALLLSKYTGLLDGSIFAVGETAGWRVHGPILLKSCIVLSSWTLGYFGIKHLPLTLVGPINATRPVMVLLGALLLYGEQLNLLQWIGVTLAVVSFFLLGREGRKEGFDFRRNVWIWRLWKTRRKYRHWSRKRGIIRFHMSFLKLAIISFLPISLQTSSFLFLPMSEASCGLPAPTSLQALLKAVRVKYAKLWKPAVFKSSGTHSNALPSR